MARPLPVIPLKRRSSIPRRIGIGLAVIVVALVFIGQGMFLVQMVKSSNGGAVDVTVPRSGTLTHRLQVALDAAVGSSDRGVRRYRISALHPAGHHAGTAVTITWAINNDLSAGSVGNGAQLDVYAMLRNIYGSHLPIATVLLIGTYPNAHNREAVVMRVGMDRATAAVVSQTGWDTVDAPTLWGLVQRYYVDPEFAPISGE